MKEKVFYMCDKCRTYYPTKEEAEKCIEKPDFGQELEVGSEVEFKFEMNLTNHKTYGLEKGTVLGNIRTPDTLGNHAIMPVVSVGNVERLLFNLEGSWYSLDTMIRDKGFFEKWMQQ